MIVLKKIAAVAALAVSAGTFAGSAMALPASAGARSAADRGQAEPALPIEHVQYYGYGYPRFYGGYGFYGPRYYGGYYGRGFYGRGYYGRGYGPGYYGRGGYRR